MARFSDPCPQVPARPRPGAAARGGLLTLGLLVLLAIFFSPFSRAQERFPVPADVPLPVDMNQLQFYLITVDVGNKVWDNFGHSALRMVDGNTGTDTVFNWGLFDAGGGMVGFSFNFFKGIMNYRLGTFTPEAELDSYRQQARTVWQEQINLNNAQKAVLYRRLVWNLQPENTVYPYQYFFDNCTTRIRDYLDEALSGKIRSASSELTSNSFRDLVLYHYRSLAVIALSLDVLMNSDIDRKVDAWEEMFLPSSLRARLMTVPADLSTAGQQQMLLSGTQVLMAFDPPRGQWNPYAFTGILLMLPVALLFTMLRRVPLSYLASNSRIRLRAPGISFRVLGITGLVIALASGIYGILMLGGWFFSGHTDLYHNWNLLLFWPTDILGIAVAGRWLLQAKPWPMTHNSAPFINYYMLGKTVAIVAYAVVAGFGLAAQSLFTILVFLVPGLFLLTLLVWLTGFELARPRHMYF